MARKSSEFYRLEKNLGDGFKSVYEFHKVIANGNCYIAHYEERNGNKGWQGKDLHCTKDSGNKYYKELKNNGFVFAGVYEMDTLGNRKKISK